MESEIEYFDLNNTEEIAFSDLKNISSYIKKNQYSVEEVINQLGEIKSTNRLGMFVLIPKNQLLNEIIIYSFKNIINSIGIIGPTIIKFSQNDLFKKSYKIEDHYSRYDNCFEYRFYFNEEEPFIIETISKDKIFYNNEWGDNDLGGFKIRILQS